MSRTRCICSLILFILLWPASAGAQTAETQSAAMVEGFIAHHVGPRVTRLHEAAQDLHKRLTEFCKAPDTPGLKDAQSVFADTYLDWMGVQHLRFGPSLEDDMFYRLQFWPDKHNRTARQLRSLLYASSPVPTPEELGEMSVALQGFPALERLLFEDGAGAFTDDAGRRCQLTVAIAANIETVAATLKDRWTAYAPEDPRETLKFAYRNYLQMFDIIKDLKLARPADKSADAARPKRAEAWRSGQSYAAVARNLESLAALFSGETGWSGLRGALGGDEETAALADSLAEQFSAGIRLIRQQSVPLSEAVSSDRERKTVDYLIVLMDALKSSSIGLLAKPLDVTEGFNSLDGD